MWVELATIAKLSIQSSLSNLPDVLIILTNLNFAGYLGKGNLAAIGLGLAYFNVAWIAIEGSLSAHEMYSSRRKSQGFVIKWTVTALTITSFYSILLSVFLLCSWFILPILFSNRLSIITKSCAYATIMIPSLWALMLFRILEKFVKQRNVQPTSAPFISSMVGVFVNFAANGLFMYWFHLGFAASPLSTVIARIASLCTLVMYCKHTLLQDDYLELVKSLSGYATDWWQRLVRCCSDEVHYVPVISGEKEYIDNSSELELLMLGSTNSLATEDSGGRLVDIEEKNSGGNSHERESGETRNVLNGGGKADVYGGLMPVSNVSTVLNMGDCDTIAMEEHSAHETGVLLPLSHQGPSSSSHVPDVHKVHQHDIVSEQRNGHESSFLQSFTKTYILASLSGMLAMSIDTWWFDILPLCIMSTMGAVPFDAVVVMIWISRIFHMLVSYPVSLSVTIITVPYLDACYVQKAIHVQYVGFLLGFVISIMYGGLIYISGQWISMIFTVDGDVQYRVWQLSWLIACFQVPYCLLEICKGGLRGLHRQRQIAGFGILSTYILHIVLSYLLAFYSDPRLGLLGYWIGLAGATILNCLVLLYLLLSMDWNREYRKAQVRLHYYHTGEYLDFGMPSTGSPSIGGFPVLKTKIDLYGDDPDDIERVELQLQDHFNNYDAYVFKYDQEPPFLDRVGMFDPIDTPEQDIEMISL